jgi:hypothetical protein
MSEKNTHQTPGETHDILSYESPSEHEQPESPLPLASPASTQTFNHNHNGTLLKKQPPTNAGSPKAHRSTTIPHISTKILRAKTGRFSHTTTVAAAFVCGMVLALIHHIVLASLHARDVNEYSQFWVKGISNAFSTCVAFFLAIATTDALSQIVSYLFCYN